MADQPGVHEAESQTEDMKVGSRVKYALQYMFYKGVTSYLLCLNTVKLTFLTLGFTGEIPQI